MPREVAFEAAEPFRLGLAFGVSAVEVGAGSVARESAMGADPPRARTTFAQGWNVGLECRDTVGCTRDLETRAREP